MVNAGFNHTDRRCKGSKSTADPELIKKRELTFTKNKAKIERFKRRMQISMLEKNVFDVEKLINEIYDYPDKEIELEHHLRMEIIKAQLFMSSYYKWRTEKRDYIS